VLETRMAFYHDQGITDTEEANFFHGTGCDDNIDFCVILVVSRSSLLFSRAGLITCLLYRSARTGEHVPAAVQYNFVRRQL
jgi:hypothetical protein